MFLCALVQILIYVTEQRKVLPVIHPQHEKSQILPTTTTSKRQTYQKICFAYEGGDIYYQKNIDSPGKSKKEISKC